MGRKVTNKKQIKYVPNLRADDIAKRDLELTTFCVYTWYFG